MGTLSHVLEVEEVTFTTDGDSLQVTFEDLTVELSGKAVAELRDFLDDYMDEGA